MTCARIKLPNVSVFELKETLGYTHGWGDKSLTLEQQIEVEKADFAGEAQGIICGDGVDVCACGGIADYLCDYPIGKGETCDLVLCEDCAFQLGEDLHLCRIHRAEFEGKAKVQKINPWPPRRSP